MSSVSGIGAGWIRAIPASANFKSFIVIPITAMAVFGSFCEFEVFTKLRG